MTKQEMLQDMADFYLRQPFQNIPFINVSIAENIDDDVNGEFRLEPADDYDYDNDELKSAYEYRSRYKTLFDGFAGMEINNEFSYMDPLNHPALSIRINKRITKDLRLTVSVLLHELLHYYLWYIGHDFHDEDIEFHQTCLNMGLPTNYTGKEWTGTAWKDTYDYSQMDWYLKMYANYLEEKEMAKAS